MRGDDREQRSAFLHYAFLQCAVTVDIELETLQETQVIVSTWMENKFDEYLEILGNLSCPKTKG